MICPNPELSEPVCIPGRIQYSDKTRNADAEMRWEELSRRWVALPRGRAVLLLDELSDSRSRLLEEWEWKGLGIRMSRGWRHCGYSPFEDNTLVFTRPLG